MSIDHSEHSEAASGFTSQYFAEEEQSLLILHNACFLLNFAFQFCDFVRWVDLNKFLVLTAVSG